VRELLSIANFGALSSPSIYPIFSGDWYGNRTSTTAEVRPDQAWQVNFGTVWAEAYDSTAKTRAGGYAGFVRAVRNER
jgi:hypothetical protein